MILTRDNINEVYLAVAIAYDKYKDDTPTDLNKRTTEFPNNNEVWRRVTIYGQPFQSFLRDILDYGLEFSFEYKNEQFAPTIVEVRRTARIIKAKKKEIAMDKRNGITGGRTK